MDVARALDETLDGFALWRVSQQHPGIPLYSGSLLEDWPAWVVDAFGIIRDELNAVRAYFEHTWQQELRKKTKG